MSVSLKSAIVKRMKRNAKNMKETKWQTLKNDEPSNKIHHGSLVKITVTTQTNTLTIQYNNMKKKIANIRRMMKKKGYTTVCLLQQQYELTEMQ